MKGKVKRKEGREAGLCLFDERHSIALLGQERPDEALRHDDPVTTQTCMTSSGFPAGLYAIPISILKSHPRKIADRHGRMFAARCLDVILPSNDADKPPSDHLIRLPQPSKLRQMVRLKMMWGLPAVVRKDFASGLPSTVGAIRDCI